MKRKLYLFVLFVFVLALSASPALASKPTYLEGNGHAGCDTIAGGTITDSKGNPLSTGFDQYGYNYQAHIFNGFYANFSRPTVPVTSGDKLVMKWSDAWLANVDCNHDGKLDRGLVNGVVGGTSLGWETNHVEGDYLDADGNLQHYTYFAKIVWTGPGSPLWGEYTLIMENYQDPTGMSHFHAAAPGFGLNDHWTTLP